MNPDPTLFGNTDPQRCLKAWNLCRFWPTDCEANVHLEWHFSVIIYPTKKIN